MIAQLCAGAAWVLVVLSQAVVLGWAGTVRVQGDGTQSLPGGFGAMAARGHTWVQAAGRQLALSRSLVGIRAEIICLCARAHGNTHACACAHSTCWPRDRIRPLGAAGLSFLLPYLPVTSNVQVGAKSCRSPACQHPTAGGMTVLLGKVTQVSRQCSRVYMLVPLRAHVHKVLRVCRSLCIHGHE